MYDNLSYLDILMKTYFSKIIPRLQKYSKKLDDKGLLINEHWVIFDEESNNRLVYIFRENNELLISKDGKVKKGNWEYLGNNSLLIDQGEDSFLFNHGFLNERVMALKVDGKNEYAILLNEQKIQKQISSLKDIYELLEDDYNSNFLNPKSSISQDLSDSDRTKKIEAPETKNISKKENTANKIYPKLIKCPKCDNVSEISQKEFELGKSYCLNCHEDFQIQKENVRDKELEENDSQEENSSENKTDNDFNETFSPSSTSEENAFLLPKKLPCPNCKILLELNQQERLRGSFECPSCDSTIDQERIKKSKNEESWYSIQGRIGRLEYFKRVLVVAIPATILESASYHSEEAGLLMLVALILFFGSIFITIQAVKRLHDLNYSGWHVLWSVVPIANLILLFMLLFKSGESGENRFGTEPD